ncbi:MAG: branched-chain amino acid transport system permease protein [Actinomycetota bacterium]|nr:branched-chain amino acid transport system permease protein [Actinomycetota bacterium]MDQ1669937.1 branched-chain amino acid transport system permease protein [Actinomycetota bacterium]
MSSTGGLRAPPPLPAEQAERGTAAPSAPPGGRRRLRGPAIQAVAVLVLATLPFLMSSYQVSTMTRILAFALLAVSVDLLTGVTGLPTLGQAAYFGVGAYAAALTALHWTANAPAQLLVAVGAGLLAAAATGWVAVRTRGIVFLMLTLAIGELVHQVADGWSFVGGSNGLTGIASPRLLPGGAPITLAGVVYWYVLAVFVLAYLGVRAVVASPFGRTLRGIRDNEPRMRAIGYRPAVAKFAVYCLAGAVAGAAGSLWITQTRFVSPGDLAFEVAALALLSVVIGGAGSLWGPCLGAGVVLLTRDYLSTYVGGRGSLLLGLVFIAVVYVLPRGLAGLGQRLAVGRRPGGEPRGVRP